MSVFDIAPRTPAHLTGQCRQTYGFEAHGSANRNVEVRLGKPVPLHPDRVDGFGR
jgi:hypothetical protein